MQKRVRRTFTDEQKRAAVDDYVSGRRTAEQIAAELNIHTNMVYRWRIELDEKAKGVRLDELQAQGISPEVAKKILEQQAIIEAYEKKVAQQAIIIDLLKKLQPSGTYQPESELTGLIDTTKKLAKSRRPAK
jgi:transposase-like protein